LGSEQYEISLNGHDDIEYATSHKVTLKLRERYEMSRTKIASRAFTIDCDVGTLSLTSYIFRRDEQELSSKREEAGQSRSRSSRDTSFQGDSAGVLGSFVKSTFSS
jgi:hypothetical protein